MIPLISPRGRSGAFMSFISTAAVTTANITIPASADDDFLGVLFDAAENGFAEGSPTLVTPSGWTNIGNVTGGGTNPMRFAVCWKKLAASDASSSITGMSGTVRQVKRMVVIKSNKSISNWAFTDGALTITDGNPSAVATDASLASDDCVAIGCTLSNGTVTATGWTPAEDYDFGNSSTRFMLNFYRNSGVSHSLDMADYGALNAAAAVTMEIV